MILVFDKDSFEYWIFILISNDIDCSRVKRENIDK